MRLPLIAIVIALAGAAPALASGGISCTSGTGPATFDISAGMGRSFGSGMFNLIGELKADLPAVARELTNLTYSDETPNQLWLDRDLLYLELSAARGGDGPFAVSDLVIKTEAVDEGIYEGRYSLSITDTSIEADGEPQHIEVAGAVSCWAE